MQRKAERWLVRKSRSGPILCVPSLLRPPLSALYRKRSTTTDFTAQTKEIIVTKETRGLRRRKGMGWVEHLRRRPRRSRAAFPVEVPDGVGGGFQELRSRSGGARSIRGRSILRAEEEPGYGPSVSRYWIGQSRVGGIPCSGDRRESGHSGRRCRLVEGPIPQPHVGFSSLGMVGRYSARSGRAIWCG